MRALALFYRAKALTTNLELFTPTYLVEQNLRVKTKQTGFFALFGGLQRSPIVKKPGFLTTRG